MISVFVTLFMMLVWVKWNCQSGLTWFKGRFGHAIAALKVVLSAYCTKSIVEYILEFRDVA